MHILLTERINDSNQYIELLARTYQHEGHSVIFDVQNFLYSGFLPDFVHIHWPEAIYRWRHQLPADQESINLIQSRLDYFKQNRIPVVYTAHNLLPHKNITDFDKRIYHIIAASADIIVHHGHASIDLIKHEVPECQNSSHVVCPHGPYDFIQVDSQQARKKYHLPPDKHIILNFGRQRQSKGPDFINEVFKNVTDKKAFLFTIGPNPPSSKAEKASRLLSHHLQKSMPDRFRKIDHFRFVMHTEIPAIFAASDIVFLGHQKGLNSGLIAHAISYKKPLVYPDLGNFREQAEGWPWAEKYTAGDVRSAVEALEKIMDGLENRESFNEFNNQTWLEKHSWEKSVSILLKEVEKIKHK